MSLTTEYSLWFTWVCILLAAGAGWLLYRNNPLRLEGRLRPLNSALFALRSLLIFCLLFLLLGPLVKWMSGKTEKPMVVIAVDNSQSVIHTKDSLLYRKDLTEGLRALSAELGDEYDVRTYLVGKDAREGASPDFTDKRSDLAAVFGSVYDQFYGQNIGAFILASDGIYNEGVNPLAPASRLNVPVYTIALGDTTQRRDLLIKNVRYNQIVYSGNSFPVQVDIAAYFCNNTRTRLTVSQDGRSLRTENVSLPGNTFFRSVNLQLDAAREGVQHFVISLSPVGNEITTVNNRYDIFINVINGKQKILLVAQAPHPDLAAFKSTIDANENYECKTILLNEYASLQKKEDYQMVILHQLPGWRGEGLDMIRKLQEAHIPALFVLGAQTGVNYLAQATSNGLAVNTNRAAVNDVTAVFQPSFSLFTFSEQETEQIKRMPPMQTPFGTFTISGESEILFKQQIGYVKTEYPLWFFLKGTSQKSGFICGEGFWKWKLYDQQLSNGAITSALMSKTIQYLAAKKDQSRFRVSGKKQFDDTEPVVFDAELYNESFELINEPNADLSIRNAEGKEFRFAFSKTEKAYTLDAGILAPGNYTYEAVATLGAAQEKVKGRFIVAPSQVEFAQTTADHQLLNEMSRSSGGKMFFPAEMDKIAREIRSDEKIAPVVYRQQELKSLINLKWIFFLLLAFVTVEWFVRKWNGTI